MQNRGVLGDTDILHSILYSGVILRVPKPTSATMPQGKLATTQRQVDAKVLHLLQTGSRKILMVLTAWH